MQTVAQSLQPLQHNINQIRHLQATTASIVQLMQAPQVLLSHLGSLVNMTDRVRTFETSLETLNAALSAVAPTSSLMQIDDEVRFIDADRF